MAESKRMFRKGTMNRDLDDRLVQPETYRYANNIKVGSSEDSDMGAIENLKGNERLSGQETIGGTTIGSVKDPNNSKVYFFNTSETKDAIYEYDEIADTISPILVDNPSGKLIKPSCRPSLSTTIGGPVSDNREKPDLEDFPTEPTVGCGLPSSTHTSSNGLFYPATAEVRDDSLCTVIATYGCGLSPSGYTSSNGLFFPGSANTRDDSLCVAIPANIVDPVAIITGNTSAVAPANVVLSSSSSTPGSLNGVNHSITSTVWSIGGTQVGTGTNYTVSGSGRTNGETVAITLTITNDADPSQTSTDTHNITFSVEAEPDVVVNPVARITGNTAANTGTNVSLSSSTSTPGSLNGVDRSIVSRVWSIGGSQVGTGTSYSLSGSGRSDGETVTVTLTITNNASPAQSDTDTHTVTFSDADVVIDPVARITGDTTATIGTDVTLSSSTSTPGSLNGVNRNISSRSWTIGGSQVATSSNYVVSGANRTDGETVTVGLTVTNDASPSQTSPQDTHTVTFSAAAANPVTLTINHNEGDLFDVDASGSITYTGNDVDGVVVNFTGTLAPSDGYIWQDELPEATLSAAAAGLTFNGLTNPSANITETLSCTLTGTYTGPTATRSISWSGDNPVEHTAQCPSPSGNFLAAAGQTRTLSLSGYTSAPTITGAPSWLTFTVSATVLTLTAGANPGPNARTASLTLSGGGVPSGSSCSFNVEQAAPAYNIPGLELDLSASSGVAPYGGYTSNLTLDCSEALYDVQYLSTVTITILPCDGSTVPSSGITYNYGTPTEGWEIVNGSQVGNTVQYRSMSDDANDYGTNEWTVQMLQNGVVIASANLGLYAGDHE